jgi:hypothetical protein
LLFQGGREFAASISVTNASAVFLLLSHKDYLIWGLISHNYCCFIH